MTQARKIKGLISVEKLAESPWPKVRLSGFAALGKRFEKKVAAALPAAVHNPWFRFCDANGVGCCSPDIILFVGQGILVLEVKLTYNPAAQAQLLDLYLPVLRTYFGRPAMGVVVVKALGRDYSGPKPYSMLREALPMATAYPFPVLLAPIGRMSHLRPQLKLGP